MKTTASQKLFQQTMQVVPGGVDNPARSFRFVGGGAPIYMTRGKGAHIWDEDGNEFVDYVMGWGVHILGHAHPSIVETMDLGGKNGVHFGTPTKAEFELCRFIVDNFESIDMVRIVNSGTEATMAAIQTARSFKGKEGLIKFVGCYHGWSIDMLTGSAYASKMQNSKIKLAPFNNIVETRRIVEANSHELAAIIVEPVAGNMGVVLPRVEFLMGLRELCDQFNLLLIFDEVMTGFRVCFPGAQSYYKIVPDIVLPKSKWHETVV